MRLTHLKYFIRKVFSSLSAVYSYKTSLRLTFWFNQVYCYWLSTEFKSIGLNAHFEKPLYLIGAKYISIGDNFYSLARLRLECWDKYLAQEFIPTLSIGNNVVLNYNVHIGCINKVIIGNNVLMASNIFISDHQHGTIDRSDLFVPPRERFLISKGPVVIGDCSWIGENVSIMPNVTLGNYCIVGANSVVTKSFPDYSVVAGNPAKLIRKLID